MKINIPCKLLFRCTFIKLFIFFFICINQIVISQVVTNRMGVNAVILNPNATQTGYINALRTSSYFREAYTENVPLSTTSFFSNQRIYDDIFSKRKPCILDAITNFYIPIIGNWGFARTNTTSATPKSWLFGAYIIPAFDIRIYQTDSNVGDFSNPVRTPSLKAGGEFIFTHTNFWNYYDNLHRRNKAALFIKGYHHSNGQDGKSINDTTTLSTKKGFVNTYNGNFSDDFPLQLGAIYLHERQNHSFFFKAGYEFSQYWIAGIDALTDKYNLYATERIMLSGNYKYRPTKNWYLKIPPTGIYLTNYNIEYLRVEWYLTYFVTSPKKWNYGSVNAKTEEQPDLKQVDYFNKRRLNLGITAHYKLPGTRTTGLFLQIGYHGQDTYNVYFQRPNTFIRFGISYGQFSYPKKTDDITPPSY